MPKYEYACKSCGERLEVTQSFTDAPLTECPACGGALRKVFSVPAIAFKGSGFYRTDNRSGRGERSEPKVDAPANGKGDAKADGKGDGRGDGKGEPAKKDTAPAASAESTARPKPKAAEAKTA
ncbi:MAG: FmdB family zinc ribbon protein [Acidimicrobiales bacterium]